MRVRAPFKEIDFIAPVKAATLKNKDRHNIFEETGLPAPPDPVLSKWSTWLIAGEHFPKVRTVVNNWKDNGVLVKKAKEAVKNTILVADLMQICQ